MKTSELIGPALDWAVINAEGLTSLGEPEGKSLVSEFAIMYSDDPTLRYSIEWGTGGPIIERERINITDDPYEGRWDASISTNLFEYMQSGPTPLIAAMRCYVASRLGADVDVPAELSEA